MESTFYIKCMDCNHDWSEQGPTGNKYFQCPECDSHDLDIDEEEHGDEEDH